MALDEELKGWTSDILDTVYEHGVKEIRASVKMAEVQLHCNDGEINTFTCDGHYHPATKLSKICLATIRETYDEDSSESHLQNINNITTKISSASCHKRRRGYERKYSQHIQQSIEQQDMSGLIRCELSGIDRAQNDTGATHNITNNKTALAHYRNIPLLPIGGIASNGTAIYATGRGYLPIQSEEGDILMVECLYSKEASGTLLSPTAISIQYSDIYLGWTVYANTRDDTGYLQFINEDGINHASINMYHEDRMWFHYLTVGELSASPTIRKLSTISEFELWHHRLGHMNPQTLCQMHKYARGIPKLKEPDFYKCQTCSLTKLRKDSSTKSKASLPQSAPTPTEKYHPGQHLHMDFGFVRGTKFVQKDDQGRTITSIDGFRAYLIVVDRATRTKYIFLTTTKHPPLVEVDGMLKKFKHLTDTLHCTVRTDQGGELGKSNKFRELVKEHGYTYEPTGSNSSKQNGMAERPNQDLKRMTRALLRAANLGPEYWSYAMNHSAYILNRSYHSGIKSTPYYEVHKVQPNLSNVKIFGSKCYYTHTKTNQKALDTPGEAGIFLGYTATEKNIYVESSKTKKIHIALHKSFDEAYMTEPTGTLPPMAIALQRAGYNNVNTTATDKTATKPERHLKIKLLSEDAVVPTRSTPTSAGLDLYATIDAVISPQASVIVPIDIAIEPENGTYAQIATRSSFAAKGVTTLGGVIDSDYRGNVKVILQNNSKHDFDIKKGQRVAQLLIKHISLPIVQVVDNLTNTLRNADGFGSTEKKLMSTPTPPPIPIDDTTMPGNTTAAAATATVDDALIDFDDNPYDNVMNITIENAGDHPTRGLSIALDEKFEKLKLIACDKSTPAGKIPRWRSTLRNSLLLKFNDIPIIDETHLRRLIRDCEGDTFIVQFGLMEKQAMNPQQGVPQLYFDQLNHIGKHLFEMKYDPDWEAIDATDCCPTIRKLKTPRGGIVPKGRRRGQKLTRRKLKQTADWSKWQQSEFLQLDQYEKQKMFGKPIRRPPNCNSLEWLWTYNIKDDGRLKARGVCNGAPSKGTVTIGPTYAGSLEQTGSRIFWAAAAQRNLRVYGADVSNAFAEAPAPVSPFYMEVDEQYREWWKSKGRGDIPHDHVLPVQHALQGHPESARLWAKLIDRLIKKNLKLKATTHEPCLYSGKFQGVDVLFLRQVDDFAIAAPDEILAKAIIEEINKHMSVQIKYLGLLTRFNGVDVEQNSDYIKIYNHTYIRKIIAGHEKWFDKKKPCHTFPIPMKSESTYTKMLESAVAPVTEKEKQRLQKEMRLNYRQAIGELIYAMVTCRPDISFPVIKLSQYSQNPAREHYEAVKDIFYYLHCTIMKGIQYWRPQKHSDLPPPLVSHDDEPDDSEARIQDKADQLKAASDSDWGGDTTHRKSLTGFVIKLAGGCVYYKSKFQPTIALSSTEAEFVAATETAKALLYVRTIMDEIGMTQKDASIIHIDNNGALNMANQQQPTKGTRHMQLKYFAIQEWVEADLIYMRRITTEHNYADAMTKNLGRTKHHYHFDYIMGCLRPSYAIHHELVTGRDSCVSRMGGGFSTNIPIR